MRQKKSAFMRTAARRKTINKHTKINDVRNVRSYGATTEEKERNCDFSAHLWVYGVYFAAFHFIRTNDNNNPAPHSAPFPHRVGIINLVPFLCVLFQSMFLSSLRYVGYWPQRAGPQNKSNASKNQQLVWFFFWLFVYSSKQYSKIARRAANRNGSAVNSLSPCACELVVNGVCVTGIF